MEQLERQQILEPADLMAERGRRHMQLLGGLGEAQVPGRGLERLEGIERGQGAAHDA